jgi:hypothetical protein
LTELAFKTRTDAELEKQIRSISNQAMPKLEKIRMTRENPDTSWLEASA